MLMVVRVPMRIRMLGMVFGFVMKGMRVVLARSFGLAIHDDINFSRADATAVHARDFEGCTDVQSFNCSLKKRHRNSSINHSAEKHVAADPGEAVEIGDAVPGYRSPVVSRSPVVRRTSHVVR